MAYCELFNEKEIKKGKHIKKGNKTINVGLVDELKEEFKKYGLLYGMS